VTSVDTRLDPTVIPLTSAAAMAPAERPPARPRRTNWLAVVAMMAVGVLSAGGARLFLSRDRGGSAAVSPRHPTDSSPTPPPAGPVITESGGRPAEPPPPPPDSVTTRPVRPAVAKDGGADGTARAGTGPAPKATGRAAPSGMTREPLRQLDGDQVHAVAFSGGGHAAVVTDTHLDVYKLAARVSNVSVPLQHLAEGLTDPMRRPTAVALSPDGRQAYLTTAVADTAERDGRPKGGLFNAVVHWEDQRTPKLLFGPPIEGIGKPEFTCIAASPDGSLLAAGTLRSRTASWWDAAVKPMGRRDINPKVGDTVAGVTFAPDGKRALFCGRDPDLCLHTLGLIGAANAMPMKGHGKGGACCAAFSADGRFAVSGGRDGKVCVWDFAGPPPADGVLRPAKELSWHEGPVLAVAFAPSGDRFLSGGADGLLCMGQVSRSDQLLRERPDVMPAQVKAVAFSGDGADTLYATDRSIGRFLLRPPAAARTAAGGAAAVAKPFATR
jgi:WD40 repeat protein